MFSYVDPTVKSELVRDGKLVSIDERGANVVNSGADPFISVVGPVPLPVHLPNGSVTFLWYASVRHSDLHRIEGVVEEVREHGPRSLFALLADHMAVNSALVYGAFAEADAPLVRVHSNCLTGDVFGSMRCDCGPQLQAAMQQIEAQGVGALIYMAGHEGRGIGLWAKAITYLLQDAGQDTYQANEKLGLPVDSRDFSDAGRILLYLRRGKSQVRLLGNNPLKREALEQVGVQVVSQEPLVVGVTAFNTRYLQSKREHGHLIPPGAVGPSRT
jgi:GTP cyclohydrolase II